MFEALNERLMNIKKNEVFQIKSNNSTPPLYDYYENLRESAIQEANNQRNSNVGLTLFLKKGMTVWIHTALELLDQRPINTFSQGEWSAGNRQNPFIKTLVSMTESI